MDLIHKVRPNKKGREVKKEIRQLLNKSKFRKNKNWISSLTYNMLKG